MSRGNSTQPNILLIVCDQLQAAALSCTGNRDLSTPNIDGLASRGVRFDSAYCSFPLCTPARASMFTGFMPHQTGVMRNEVSLSGDYRSTVVAHTLNKAGYRSLYGGKWHVPELSIPDGQHGFDCICDFDDRRLVDSCIDFLGSAGTEPWFLTVSFDNPHNICEWAREQRLPWGEVESAPVEGCPDLPANFAVPPYEPEVVQYGIDRVPRAYGDRNSSSPDWWRTYRNAYYRLVEKVDDEIGRMLAFMEEESLLENTVVIFTSDHGESLGAHRCRQKTFLYEEAVRVPLIVRADSMVSHPGSRSDRLVSVGIDLVPSLCELAGLAPSRSLPGNSFIPALQGMNRDENDRRFVVTETGFADDSIQGRMLRTRRYKYSLYNWGRYREQLIDLEQDPGEMVNLSRNVRYHAILTEHRELLREWIRETGDPFGRNYANPETERMPC